MDKIKFVEAKHFDMGRIDQLLEVCRTKNHWTNWGPLQAQFVDVMAAYMSLPGHAATVSCTSGGVALEAMARLIELEHAAPMRWITSAFSFKNLGRGYFANAAVLDCTPDGMLDLSALEALPQSDYDGIVLTNPFGGHTGLQDHIQFAKKQGKALIIDNAAGVHSAVPDWPWQAFSFHQTKPFGAGEGGMAVVPKDKVPGFRGLIDYAARPSSPAAWLNNGKLSDISVAFLLARFEDRKVWLPRYAEQRERVTGVAATLGLKPLIDIGAAPPTMSVPLAGETPIPIENLSRAQAVAMAKYYAPIESRPEADRLFQHVLCVPTHPDMAGLSDAALKDDLARVLGLMP